MFVRRCQRKQPSVTGNKVWAEAERGAASRRRELGRERGQRCTWLVTSDSCWLICSTPPIATESAEPR